MNRVLIFVIFILHQTWECSAQRKIDLMEVVAIAKNNSLEALKAENNRDTRYWSYRSFKAGQRPQLTLSGELPNLQRTFKLNEQDDGSVAFVERSSADYQVDVGLRQIIPFTGGNIFLGSGLSRLDQFGENETTIWSSTPIIFRLTQPLFTYNNFKWDKAIRPLVFQESKKEYVEDLERTAQKVVRLFFDVLIEQVSVGIAEKNLANNDTIYKMSSGRYQLGKIGENDLLRLELNLLKSNQALRTAKLNLESTILKLNTFLGFPEQESILLKIPSNLPVFSIDEYEALEMARRNNAAFLGFKRKRLQADQVVAQAKGDQRNGLSVSVNGRLGLNDVGSSIDELYNDPAEVQVIGMGIQVPVMDWGKRRASIRSAESNSKVMKAEVQQEELNLEQQILIMAKQFVIQKERVFTAEKADYIAERSYEIAKRRFMVAKISITDLNDALKQKDEAKKEYINALKAYWNAYFEIRATTLYDFETQQMISTSS